MSNERAKANSGEADKICGIVMPISDISGYEAGHWEDVCEILRGAIIDSGFEPKLVSNSDEVSVIHQRIVTNLYDNPIVVCDVSSKNPNVMFELGIRLAFDKPTVIVKDNLTAYSFDTSPIEHLGYRSDLKHQDVVRFKAELTAKIKATVERARNDKGYSPFLSHFQRSKRGGLPEVSSQEYLENQINNVLERFDRLEAAIMRTNIATIRSRSSQAESISSEALHALRPLFSSPNGIKGKRLDVNADELIARYNAIKAELDSRLKQSVAEKKSND